MIEGIFEISHTDGEGLLLYMNPGGDVKITHGSTSQQGHRHKTRKTTAPKTPQTNSPKEPQEKLGAPRVCESETTPKQIFRPTLIMPMAQLSHTRRRLQGGLRRPAGSLPERPCHCKASRLQLHQVHQNFSSSLSISGLQRRFRIERRWGVRKLQRH